MADPHGGGIIQAMLPEAFAAIVSAVAVTGLAWWNKRKPAIEREASAFKLGQEGFNLLAEAQSKRIGENAKDISTMREEIEHMQRRAEQSEEIKRKSIEQLRRLLIAGEENCNRNYRTLWGFIDSLEGPMRAAGIPFPKRPELEPPVMVRIDP